MPTSTTLCGISLEEYFLRMEEFHGVRSPGMVLSGLMVDQALAKLGHVPYLNVAAETVVCLPDAIQILTGCTIGNGFLQVFDWGKFALTAYDRRSLEGVRVWLEAGTMDRFPMVQRWFDRERGPNRKPAFDELAGEMLAAGAELMGWRNVRLLRALKEEGRVPTGLCRGCGESHALRNGPMCPACRGDGYLLAE